MILGGTRGWRDGPPACMYVAKETSYGVDLHAWSCRASAIARHGGALHPLHCRQCEKPGCCGFNCPPVSPFVWWCLGDRHVSCPFVQEETWSLWVSATCFYQELQKVPGGNEPWGRNRSMYCGRCGPESRPRRVPALVRGGRGML
jgi:hypothetical protein